MLSFDGRRRGFKKNRRPFGTYEGVPEGFKRLCLSARGAHLVLAFTHMQDNPLQQVADEKMIPILGLDVWEREFLGLSARISRKICLN